MLNLHFNGITNFFFRFPKTSTIFNIGFKNFYLFIYFCKKLFISDKIIFTIKFFKKYSNSIHLLKAAFKYKTTKHKLFYLKNNFRINLMFSNNNCNKFQLMQRENILYFFKIIKIFNFSNIFLQTIWIKFIFNINCEFFLLK